MQCKLVSILFIFLLLTIIFSLAVVAGTLKGKIYDVSMDEAREVTIDIDTVPRQRYLSRDSAYSFKVSPGNYTLKAQQFKNENIVAQTEESISIEEDGEYKLDLVLFPVIETQDELLGDSIFDVKGVVVKESFDMLWVIIGLVIVALSGIGAYTYIVKNRVIKDTKDQHAMIASTAVVRELDKLTLERALPTLPNTSKIDQKPIEETKDVKETKEDLSKVIEFIKKTGGRTTQKELRKNFSSSEAKISLMITELEHKGILEKIKNGRGNVLILREKKESKVQ